jgi:hypothetical protein
MSVNWGNLVAKGRAKAFGIPWTEKEQAALQEGVPVEYVRNGVLSMKDYKEVKGKHGDEKPSNYMTKAELQEKAKQLGIAFVPETTRAELLALVYSNKEETSQQSTVTSSVGKVD